MLISIAIRCFNIDQKNLWFDEVYSWKISQGSVKQVIIETSGDIHPPFYYVILKTWTHFFSDTVASMRMLSVLLGVLSMYFVYKISRLVFKDQTRIILVMVLYCFSPLNIYYSQEVRMLNLNLLLCLGSVYFLLKFLDTEYKRYAVLNFLFTMLAIYTHYFAFLILFSELIIVLLMYLKKRIDAGTLTVYSSVFMLINIFYLPWYPTFFQQISKGQPWRTEQTLPEVGGSLVNFLSVVFLSPYHEYAGAIGYYLAIASGFFIMVFIIVSLVKSYKLKNFLSEQGNVVSLFFMIPLLTALVISWNQSLLLSRYLSIIVPYIIVSMIYFAFRYYEKRTGIIIIITLIILSITGTYIYFDKNFKNNDYREVISYLESNYENGEEIIVEPHFMGWSINYHVKHSQTILKSPAILGWDLKMQLEELRKRSDINKVWMLLDYSSMNNASFDSLDVLMSDIGFTKVEDKTFYVIPDRVRAGLYRR